MSNASENDDNPAPKNPASSASPEPRTASSHQHHSQSPNHPNQEQSTKNQEQRTMPIPQTEKPTKENPEILFTSQLNPTEELAGIFEELEGTRIVIDDSDDDNLPAIDLHQIPRSEWPQYDHRRIIPPPGIAAYLADLDAPLPQDQIDAIERQIEQFYGIEDIVTNPKTPYTTHLHLHQPHKPVIYHPLLIKVRIE